jgi:putative DNA primase/helicase
MNVAFHPDERALAFNRELVTWACRYAARGIPVFPVSGSKVPHVKWKDTGGTTDPDQISAWWKAWPLAMIGAPTGSRSGLVVLDIDCKNGVNGFETMKAQGWSIPPEVLEVRTPSGGSHFYFRATENQTVRNSAGKIGPGIDIRGEGGMVILPPSRPQLDGPDYHFAEGQWEDGGKGFLDGLF